MKDSFSNPKPKPNSSKVNKQSDAIFMVVSISLTALVCIAIAGVLFYIKFTNQRNAIQISAVAPTELVATAISALNYTPVFESGECPFQIPEGANVTCGFVVVPEDRDGNLGDTIQLAVAIYHNAGAEPSTDPILYLQGGPGDEALVWSVGVYQSVIAPLVVDRDFVIFDPRGVGLSKPALECDEIKHTYLSDLQERFPAAQRASYYEGALLTCRNKFGILGVNLAKYTSFDMAADARDVLKALGYQQANLYGISYGTRIAQFVMKSYPEIVHAAVLDSVVPVEVQMLDQGGAAQEQALQTLLEDCTKDPACSTSFPDVRSTYTDTINQLNTQPIPLKTPIDQTRSLERTINGAVFHDILLWMLRAPETIRVIPQMIYQTHLGDYSTLRMANALPIHAFDTISAGAYIAVNCHDQVFAMSVDKLDETLRGLCQVWQISQPLPWENEPVHSEIPVLIIAGKYDSITPVSFATQLSEHFSKSHLVVISNQGHAPSATGVSDCPIRMIAAFLKSPGVQPDTTCMTQAASVNFAVPLDPRISLSYESTDIDQYQISTRIPSGWSAGTFGFYNRNSWFGDPTQIGIQRAAVSETDWVTWLTTNFGGTLGLDQIPVKYGERKANGLTWSMYQSSSSGLPVEIAFAKSKNETLMVLLISDIVEHDALHDLVLLPVIDSISSTK